MGSQAAANLQGSQRLGSYLRRLRTGYGYSLRRVEERARAEGGEIDNSQLSRYEKGICYPSFDKLRILASVFNVSIQSFSDVVELEAYEDLKPEATDPKLLLADGGADGGPTAGRRLSIRVPAAGRMLADGYSLPADGRPTAIN